MTRISTLAAAVTLALSAALAGSLSPASADTYGHRSNVQVLQVQPVQPRIIYVPVLINPQANWKRKHKRHARFFQRGPVQPQIQVYNQLPPRGLLPKVGHGYGH